MNSAWEKDAHEQDGTSCIKAKSENLFESTRNRVTSYSDEQYIGPDLLFENGERHVKVKMVCLSKHIWELLLRKKVIMAAKYLPSVLNKHVDIESCCKTDSSEWKLALLTF